MLGFFKKFFKVHRVWWTVSILMRGGTSDFQKCVWWSKYFCMKITAKHRPSRSKLGRWTGDTFARIPIKPRTYIFGHKKMGGIAHQYVYVGIYNRTWCCFSVLALINTTFGIFGRWTMTVNTVHGRCLTVILIQKYLYHQTGFCAFEVPPRIEIETVHQTWHTLKNFLKNPNILIFFRFSWIT